MTTAAEQKLMDIKFKLDMYYAAADTAENTLEKIQEVLKPNKDDLTKYVKVFKKEDWNEEISFALWWDFPIVEPPYVGDPLCDDFPDYKTHFTLLPPVQDI